MNRSTLRRLALIPAAVAASVSPLVHAAVDAGVTTTLTDAKTDVGTVGLAVFGIIVAMMVFKWFRKAL